MNEDTEQAFASAVETSLQSEIGQQWLNRTHAELLRAVSEKKFNTERAQEMYAIAIERSVSAKVGGAMGVATITALRRSGVTAGMARELVAHFKEATGAVDQRPARMGILAMIIGK